MDENKILRFAQLIKDSKNIVFFGGAGVSTESGMKDYRSEDGLYNTVKQYKVSPETILSRSFFGQHPDVFYDFYYNYFLNTTAEPNRAHHALVELEKMGKLKAVITQNVDGLHQRAGSENVIELHGTILKHYCPTCKTVMPNEKVKALGGQIPRCEKCHHIVKVTKEVYIVEEEAKVVRSIFQMFLDGKSAGQIKAELEKNGVKTYRGKSEWQPKLITTMLQNEKYCGDVMHQKTYCVDCISKRKKINNGKKTKYLVIDDHPQIISRSMYYAAQSEMARRNAQRSKSEDSISDRGRYSGKHALSELLVCAECGSHYRRKYHKKKDGAHYYWRCISRLENGDKYCSNSKGLEEELLKKTICEALSSVLAKRENGYEVLKSRMIYAAAGDEHSNELYVIEMAISDAMGRIDELTELAVKFKSNRDKYDAAIGECNEQLRVLREKKENILEQLNHNEKARKEMERIEKHLTEDMVVIPEFNDGFIRRMVTSIRVTQDNNLQICIKGGYEIMASFPCDKNAA